MELNGKIGTRLSDVRKTHHHVCLSNFNGFQGPRVLYKSDNDKNIKHTSYLKLKYYVRTNKR